MVPHFGQKKIVGIPFGVIGLMRAVQSPLHAKMNRVSGVSSSKPDISCFNSSSIAARNSASIIGA